MGFWADGALRKAPTTGGEPQRIAEMPAINGATWGAGDRIVVAETVGSLLMVDANTKQLDALTRAGAGMSHDAPSFLGRDQVLFDGEATHLAIASTESGEWQALDLVGQNPRWSPTGHIVYKTANEHVWACAFDPVALVRTGEPFQVMEETVLDFDLARDGTLVFVPGTSHPYGERVWVDREGRATPLGFETERYLYMSESSIWWLPADGGGERKALHQGRKFDVRTYRTTYRTRFAAAHPTAVLAHLAT